jgi:hypothetical protein
MSQAMTVFRADPAATASLAVTSATGRVAVFGTAPDVTSQPCVRLYNAGAVTVFVEFGTSAVTAAVATGFPLPPGAIEVFRVDRSQVQVAAITASGTATLYATPGYGA